MHREDATHFTSNFDNNFYQFLGSGQKLLARLLDEHPFVTVKQPSNYIRHVSLFSEAWFEEESLETNRLNEGGISKEVLLDTPQVRSTSNKVKRVSNRYIISLWTNQERLAFA